MPLLTNDNGVFLIVVHTRPMIESAGCKHSLRENFVARGTPLG